MITYFIFMCQYKPSDGFKLRKQKRLIITQLTYNFKEHYQKKKKNLQKWVLLISL